MTPLLRQFGHSFASHLKKLLIRTRSEGVVRIVRMDQRSLVP
jgi:hypothetical protein